MRWQKRARLVIAIFGLAFAVVVFFAIGEREQPVAAPALERLDPKAVVESSGNVLQRITGTREDFTISADRQLAYEKGAAKLTGVRIDVKGREGRDFVITGREAQVGEKEEDVQLTGGVKLAASDGFEVATDRAAFSQKDGMVRAPGELTFKKGMMSGTGVGMSYDRNTDVLTILDQAHVKLVDEGGNTTSEFAAGAATLSRQEDYLLLERTVHALRGEQTLDADSTTARLSEKEEYVRYIELRGRARVTGGSTAFDSMSARDIDLDYSDDGEVLERVVLAGSGMIALKGQGGAQGRQMLGESLTLALAPDGAVTSAVGRDTVQLDLPAANGGTARHVRAKTLDAAGQPGKGMTSARFSDDVEYGEDGTQEVAARTAKSKTLTVALDGDVMTSAIFTGTVRFEEKALKASAAEGRYDPTAGVLGLKGVDEGGGPLVADEQISVEADAITLTLKGRQMLATGKVKTTLRAGAKAPGLLNNEQPTMVSASTLEYAGEPGRATYSGSAQLLQGTTAIRGNRLMIDQEKGTLFAIGAATSTLAFGKSTSVGRGEEIRYEDATRHVTYVGAGGAKGAAGAVGAGAVPSAPAPTPAAPSAPVAPSAPIPPQARLAGPEGDLQADRIVVVLARAASQMERLEAYTNITLRVDARVATGARLTYYAKDERYVMSGAAAVPVRVVEQCRETTGKTLTFFRSADTIIVDGNEEIRTRTKGGGPCPEPRSP